MHAPVQDRLRPELCESVSRFACLKRRPVGFYTTVINNQNQPLGPCHMPSAQFQPVQSRIAAWGRSPR